MLDAKNLKIYGAILIFIIVIIIGIGIYTSTNLFEQEAAKTKNIEIPSVSSQEKVLTVTYNSVYYSFSLDELMSSFQAVSGLGTSINQLGKISGPNNYTGVPIYLLLQSIDKCPDEYWLIANSSYYSYNFSNENVSGKTFIYDENNQSYLMGNMTMVVAYEMNGKFLNEITGGPLRIVFLDKKGSITHSSMWVSSVDKLMLIKKEEKTEKIENIPPIVSINASNTGQSLTVYFQGNALDPDGYITSFQWDFGDGSLSTEKNPIHSYLTIGAYEVRLTVTDNEGARNSSSKYIVVGNQKPIPDFSYTPVKPIIGNNVFFTDKSTDVDGSIIQWFWDFGDGTSSSEKNPSHQYVDIGTFKVKLTVEDNFNSVSETSREIIVTAQSNNNTILTITYDGNQKTYTLEDLENMVSMTGYGGRINKVGVIQGPFEYKGVPISVLANEFSLNPTSYTLTTISSDGYVYNYTQDEIQGNIQVYDTEGNELGIGGVTMILAYEEEGMQGFPDGPLRIAYVADEKQVTDAFRWAKYVTEIEFFEV